MAMRAAGAGCEDLIGAGEILKLFEVLGDDAGEGVEDGAFDEVSPVAFAGGHEHVTHSPGPVGEVAGFVEGEVGGGAEAFGGNDSAVGHHAVGFDFAVGGFGELEGLGVAGIGIGEGEEFELFGGGDAVFAEGGSGFDFGFGGEGFRVGEEEAVVDIFGEVEEALIAGESVAVEGFFGDEAIAAGADAAAEEIGGEDVDGGGITGGAVMGHEGAADDGVGPAEGGFAEFLGAAVGEDVVEVCAGDFLCGGVGGEEAGAYGAVDEIAGLFEAPPEFWLADGGIGRASGEHAGVVGVAEVFGVAGEACDLAFDPSFEPAAREDGACGEFAHAAEVLDL